MKDKGKGGDKLTNGKRKWWQIQGIRRIYKQLPYVYFIGFLTLIYIANVHKAQKNVRKIHHLQKEVREKQWEYWSTASGVQYEGIQSNTEKRVEPIGLQSLKEAPEVITVEKE